MKHKVNTELMPFPPEVLALPPMVSGQSPAGTERISEQLVGVVAGCAGF